MNVFPARYNGLCNPCAEDILKGQSITNHREYGYVHEECALADEQPRESDEQPTEYPSHGRAPIAVLPRGKTAKDRCDKCFIIHTPGQVGCE